MHKILTEYRKRIGYSKLESDLMTGGTIPYNMFYISANPQISIEFILAHPEIEWDLNGIFCNPNLLADIIMIYSIYGLNSQLTDEHLLAYQSNFAHYNPNCDIDAFKVEHGSDKHKEIVEMFGCDISKDLLTLARTARVYRLVVNNPAIKYKDLIKCESYTNNYPSFKPKFRWHNYPSELLECASKQVIVCNPGLTAEQHKRISYAEGLNVNVTLEYGNPQYLLIYYDCKKTPVGITNGNVWSILSDTYYNLWCRSYDREYLLNVAASNPSLADKCYEILSMECGIYSRPEFMMAAIKNIDSMRSALYACKSYTDCLIRYVS